MDAKPSYLKGQTVKVEFWGAHPRNDLKIQDTYLTVERRSGDNWDVVSNDGDPDTLFRWKRVFPSCSKITVEWTTHHQSQPGEYRIRHFGRWKNLLTGKVKSYSGASRTFFIDE